MKSRLSHKTLTSPHKLELAATFLDSFIYFSSKNRRTGGRGLWWCHSSPSHCSWAWWGRPGCGRSGLNGFPSSPDPERCRPPSACCWWSWISCTDVSDVSAPLRRTWISTINRRRTDLMSFSRFLLYCSLSSVKGKPLNSRRFFLIEAIWKRHQLFF